MQSLVQALTDMAAMAGVLLPAEVSPLPLLLQLGPDAKFLKEIRFGTTVDHPRRGALLTAQGTDASISNATRQRRQKVSPSDERNEMKHGILSAESVRPACAE